MESMFEGLQLKLPFLKALNDENYKNPTPIQQECIPKALNGSDILGIAQTGTGKTAAFSIPILQMLNASQPANKKRDTRALILAPTRELAIQIGSSVRLYGKYIAFKHTLIYGGVGQKTQVESLKRGVDLIIATPGRLLDLISQGVCKLDKVEYFVLDEADRMLDMGFINDVKKIVKVLPKQKQTLFFSATMPPAVENLASKLLNYPEHISIEPSSTPVQKIKQLVSFVRAEDKRKYLKNLLKEIKFNSVIIFTRTKHGANRLSTEIKSLNINSDALHGNKSQAARQRTLKDFKLGKINVLVATDIAARGIDIEGVSHIINFELPNVPEDYIHRIGRTARAGASGTAISICAPNEQPFLESIEKLMGFSIKVSDGKPSTNREEIYKKNKKRLPKKSININKTHSKTPSDIDAEEKRTPNNRRKSNKKKRKVFFKSTKFKAKK